MTAEFLRMPGTNCIHYAKGRCLLTEHQNPGLDQEIRCRELRRLGKEFDDFLVHAEHFDIGEDVATRILQERMQKSLQRQTHCQAYHPGDTDSLLGCAHALGDLCAQSLPRCPGRCPAFSAKPENDI
ncbi:hypothetical protein [Desulfovibrio inopinatus]|uniref:hypothetical protein n=1 Tax=Desulfovibrio inopinatus TaxID=102109 RepID=UPI0004105E15|nr:hypothetical protein [Desulfovibrio inopinatus]